MSAVEIFVESRAVAKRIRDLKAIGMELVGRRSTEAGAYLQFKIPSGVSLGLDAMEANKNSQPPRGEGCKARPKQRAGV